MRFTSKLKKIVCLVIAIAMILVLMASALSMFGVFN